MQQAAEPYDDTFAKGAGHPPSAAKTVCVDLDSTIIPWGDLMGVRDAFPGVAEAMHLLRDAGYRIVILTSRLSSRWWYDEAKLRDVDPLVFGGQQHAYVQQVLQAAGVPYDLITAEKVPALVYFDDKAVRVDDVYTLENAIGDFIHGLYQ